MRVRCIKHICGRHTVMTRTLSKCALQNHERFMSGVMSGSSAYAPPTYFHGNIVDGPTRPSVGRNVYFTPSQVALNMVILRVFLWKCKSITPLGTKIGLVNVFAFIGVFLFVAKWPFLA